MKNPRSLRRPLLALCTLIFSFLLAASAFAAGRLDWKSRTIKERDDKSWKIEVAIYMSSAPDVPHVPMKFEFLPTAYYERDMMDGDKLVERKVPLENHQALIESVDVGFLDSGSGKIEPRTRFSFKLTRGNGYEAGEYRVTVRDTRNGQVIGAPTTLIFEGENDIIDRRAMVFASDKKKEKKDKPAEGADKKDDAAKTDAPAGEEGAANADKKAETLPPSETPPADEASEDDPDGEIKEKPGGCGCRLAGSENVPVAPLGLALALGALLALRRRQA